MIGIQNARVGVVQKYGLRSPKTSGSKGGMDLAAKVDGKIYWAFEALFLTLPFLNLIEEGANLGYTVWKCKDFSANLKIFCEFNFREWRMTEWKYGNFPDT